MIGDQVKTYDPISGCREGDHCFLKSMIGDIEDIFAVQSEVAQTIAKEIEVAITPEEKATY